jgi:hypothetical protein
MAKKTASTAVSTIAPTVTSLMNIKAQFDFSNQDLINIVSTKIEDDLRGQLRIVNGEIKKLREEREGQKKKLDKLFKTRAEAVLAERKAMLEAFITSWYKGDDQIRCLENIHIYGGETSVQIDCNNRNLPSFSMAVKPTEEMTTVKEAIVKLDKTMQTKEGICSQIHTKLADIPNMERKAMAQLTRHSIANSEAGKEYMAQIDSIVGQLSHNFLVSEDD